MFQCYSLFQLTFCLSCSVCTAPAVLASQSSPGLFYSSEFRNWSQQPASSKDSYLFPSLTADWGEAREGEAGYKTAWIITIISPLSHSLYANHFKKPATRNNAISDFLRLWSVPRPSNDCGFPGVWGQLMQIWSPAKWADRTMLSRPWVFLSSSHPGNCALSQTQPSLSLSLSLSCTPSSGASQTVKYNCGESENWKV